MLDATTVDDARDVYAAIRLASPGGLGRADAQDVADEPTVTLLEVMRLAADRDGIAREYATAFDVTFGTGVPALDRPRGATDCSWDDAVVETFLTLLAAAPDTHIARRGGAAVAAAVTERARARARPPAVSARRQAARRSPRWTAGCATRGNTRQSRHHGGPDGRGDLRRAARTAAGTPADGGDHAATR